MTSVLDPRVLQYDGDEEREGFPEPPRRKPKDRSLLRRLAQALLLIGTAALLANWFDLLGLRGTWLGVVAAVLPLALGAILGFHRTYAGTAPGQKHDGITFAAATYRGWVGWTAGIGLMAFYVALYWRPWALTGVIRMVDPVAMALAGKPADQYFLYSFLYTVSVLVFGVRMFYRYRHNRYHLLRTGSVMFFQLAFAFLIPQYLRALEQPEFYPSYFWPLAQKSLFPDSVHSLLEHPGGLGIFMVVWGALLTVVATPVLTYFYGKRWYCSWVCGCGGLAETMGDAYRQLSDKSTRAWKFERVSIYSVLAAVTVLTASLWIWPGAFSESFRKVYGFAIASMFAGVIGTGFYPLLGSRVWCRFGCPMAAILGICQRLFSRFRITTNGGQCMSCGNCSTFCEMGIDVRAYAQRGENIVRASCVGCGVCAAACPRGVLKLENGMTHQDRYDGADSPIGELLRRHADGGSAP